MVLKIEYLKEFISQKGKYIWHQFNEEKSKCFGFENTEKLLKNAEEDKELEINNFFKAIRFLPTTRVRNVEVGRICVVTFGSHYGKKCIITDIVDQTRVVIMGVDGILSDLKPQSFPIRRLHLTNARVKGLSQRGHRLKKVKNLVNASLESLKKMLTFDRKLKQISKFKQTRSITDFQRFKIWAKKVG